MFRTKKDVDRHVQDVFRKLKNENEKNLRCYNIAKLYYQVGDYESARRYVSSYLEIRKESVGAHKLLGQTLEALGQKEAALAEYKESLELEPRQDDLVLKVCELLADMNVSMDVSGARYWVERADRQFPHHPVVFQLKEKMLTMERPNDNSEDLEALIASELSARPTDVHLRVKLLKHYITKHRLEDAYIHASDVEATHSHRNSVSWYQSLSELLTKCKESKQTDWSFWILYISSLERFAALSLKEQGHEVKKTVLEATQAVFNFDQALHEMKSKNFSNNPTFTEQMLQHMWGQLHFHLACLFLRKTKQEQGSWNEAGRLCAPLFLSALHVTPIDPTATWALHLKDRLKSQVRLWHREGSYRCSQSGHVLQDYGRDDAKKLLDKIDKFCTGPWRERVYQRIFMNRIHQTFIETSYFSHHTARNPPLRLCSHSELKRYDEVSEEVWPDSLHHQVWLALKNRPHKSHNKENGPHPNQTSHVFPDLQFSVYNLNQAAPDSLSRLDVDAFLNAATFCASALIEEQQLSGFLNPERLPTLPADLTSTLCTCVQEKWWSAAYKMYSKREALDGDIGEIRLELQRGLEVVRCIGNHGMHPTLVVHLARIFHHRAKTLKEKDKEHTDIPALEARCEIYWSNAVPLLERLQNNQTIRVSSTKLFNYQGKEMNNAELTNALEEGRLLLAQRFVRDKQYEQAIDALQALKCPEASFQQGQIYKALANEVVSSMPRESLTSEMRSQHIIMLSKARNCFYLTLDRLRRPGTNPKHPLNSELCTHIADIENELKRIDPDLSRGDLSRNECDGMSEESYSSAHSGVDEPIANAPLPTLTGLSTSVNMLNTPQRNTHRTPKQSSTPCRPQHQDLLDLSRNRVEARPSPERLDAQIRQIIHSRDNIMQTIIEQNKAVLESNKAIMEKIEELTKEMADLRKETQKQRSQSINVNSNMEENLYVLGDYDYEDLNYNANQSGPASSISGNIFTPSQRNPYLPLVHPSATAFQGYYQGGLSYNDPNAQPIPSLYPPNVYPMPVLYPNRQQKMAENILQQGLFTPRLPTQLPDLMPTPTQPPMQIPPQKVEVSKPETIIKDAPVNKVPPVNVVITTSDTLPTSAPLVQPTLSVTIPPHYRLGGTTTVAPTIDQSNIPHCYQISMPSQATIPTTVNLPPLSATLTITPASMSIPEMPRNIDATNVCTNQSLNVSGEVCETEHDPIPDFVPVIPLPAEVKVTTGEEDETTLYCARAKLFRYATKEWKERGVGTIKLLMNDEGKVRLLMRRDLVLKICANHMLRPDMELTTLSSNEKAWVWYANDFADEEVKLEKFCIRFKTVEEAQSFKEHFDKAKMGLLEPPEIPLEDEAPSKTKTTKAKDKLKVSEEPTAATKPTATGRTAEVPMTPEKNQLSLDESMGATLTVGMRGFAFSSKPIIQPPPSDLTKTEAPPKVNPFAGFTFDKGATTAASTASMTQKSTAVSTPPVSQPFSIGKTAATVPSVQPDSTVVTTSSVSPIFSAQPTAAAYNNANVPPRMNATSQQPLRRPHLPAPASATGKSSVVGIQDSEVYAQSENEQTLFEGRTTLQYYNGDTKMWESRGMGQMKVLLDSKTGRLRLSMMEEVDSKICYNHRVSSKTSFSFKSGSNTIINWSIQHGKHDSKTGTFSATFKTADQASQFYNTLLNNQQKMVKDCVPVDGAKRQEASSQKVQASKAQQQVPLSELFKPPAGSWSCDACYTQNESSAMKCIACAAPSPSAASCKPAAPAPTPVSSAPTMNKEKLPGNQVPLSEMFKPPANSWECKYCYIVNTGANSYCVACESPKDPSMPPKPKTNAFQLGSSASGPKPTFSFGIPQTATKEAPGEFKFRLSTSNDKPAEPTTFATATSTTKPDASATKFVFGMAQRPTTPPNKEAPFNFGSPGKSFDFDFAAKQCARSPGGENSEEEVVESDDIHFSPIIPLPDKIDAKTGEEDEEVLYSHRAKLFRYDTAVSEWKERGLGEIKLLRHKETGKLRLIMRRDQILKLCLNHFVLPDSEFNMKDQKTWVWAAGDYSNGMIEYVNLACRFKTPEIAQDFMHIVESARNGELVHPISDKAKPEAKAEENTKSSPTRDIEILYEMKVTPEEKAAALKLKLPENFYAYKQKPDCPGCRGCKEPEVPLFDTKDSQKPLSKVIAPPKSIGFTTATTMQFSSPSSATSATTTMNDVKPFGQSSISSAAPNATSSVFGGFGMSSGAAPFKPSSVSTGFDTSTMSFGNSDFNALNEKKTDPIGFSFGMPQSQLSSSDSTQKFTISDKQTGLENLKICGPSSPSTQVTVSGTTTAQSPFGVTTSASSIFRLNTSNTESPFNLETAGKNIFGGSSKKPVSSLIKPSTFEVSANNTAASFSNSFGAQSKSPTSPTTTSSNLSTFWSVQWTEAPGTTTTSTVSSSRQPVSTTTVTAPQTFPTFGPLGNAFPASTSVFGGNTKTTQQGFGNMTMPFSPKLTFGTNTTNATPLGEINATTTDIFKAKPTESTPGKSETVPFLPATNLSFSTLAANAPQQEAFKTDPNFSFAGAGSCVFGSKATPKGSAQEKKADTGKKEGNDEDECDENEEEQEHDPHFEPIVPLPDAIEVRTGEEDEEKILGERAKLYRFDGTTQEWKERGVGEMKILHHVEQGRYRLLLRREQVHKVVCNFLITTDMTLAAQASSDRSWVWAGMNFAEDPPAVERLAIKFRTAEQANRFKETVENIQQTLRELREKTDENVGETEEPEDQVDKEDEQRTVIDEKRATLYARANKDEKWKHVALGTMIVYYDWNTCIEHIILKADESHKIVSKTVISKDTEMEVKGKECIWTSIDYALEPPTRRTLKAVFSSLQAADQMFKRYQDGLDWAKGVNFTESYDERGNLEETLDVGIFVTEP